MSLNRPHQEPASPHKGLSVLGAWLWWGVILGICSGTWVGAATLEGTNVSLDSFTIDGGGGFSADGFFELRGTLGQPDTGISTDGFFVLQSGFWSASLTSPPMITSEPAGQIIDFGDAVNLQVEVAGTPPFQYQWYLNNTRLRLQTNTALVITNFMLFQSGAYTVVVRNEFGAVQSSKALLLPAVTEIAPADNFVDRVPLGPGDTLFRGSNQGATREPGEPNHADRWSGSSVWYTWSTNVSGIARIRTLGSTFDSLLAVYTGASVIALTELDADDDRGGFLGSEVRFNVDAGTSYHIAVDGLARREGIFILSLEFQPTTNRLPVITNHPVSQAVRPGQTASFITSVLGSSLNFQWFFNSEPISSATGSFLTTSAVKPSQIGTYYLAVTNSTGRGLISRPASLEFGPQPGRITYNKVEDLLFKSGLTPAGNLTSLQSPERYLREGGSGGAIPVGFVSVSVGTIDQQVFRNGDGTNSIDCAGCEPGAGLAKYFGLKTDQSGWCILDTIGSSIDTVMSVFEYDSAAAFINDPCSFLVQCDAGSAPDGTNCLVAFEATPGQSYIVMVDSQSGDLGNMVLNWQLCPIPAPFQIISNSLTLTTATNLQPYLNDTNYYWYQDGAFRETTLWPVLATEQPLLTTTHYSVAYLIATNGSVAWVTNHIGSFVSAGFDWDSAGPEPGFKLLLNNAEGLEFQLEGTLPGSEQDPQCELPWLWSSVTNYSVVTQASSLILSLPMETSSRFYRIRPTPLEPGIP